LLQILLLGQHLLGVGSLACRSLIRVVVRGAQLHVTLVAAIVLVHYCRPAHIVAIIHSIVAYSCGTCSLLLL